MGKRITSEQRRRVFNLIGEGVGVSEIARNVGVGRTFVYALQKGHGSQDEYRKAVANAKIAQVEQLGRPKRRDELCPEAIRALDDFAYFRTRYMGRVNRPWHLLVCAYVMERLADPNKTYDVMNVVPGSGKSALVVDIAAWLICRNRRIRIAFGSAKDDLAVEQGLQLRRMFERTTPYKATDRELDLGLAVDGEGVLAVDFGIFKPLNREDVWRADGFVVTQDEEFGAITERNFTLTCIGKKSRFKGSRFDVMFWDDVDDKDSIATDAAVQEQRKFWDEDAESRLEPAGALFLVMQRLASVDLSRYNLDKRAELDFADEFNGDLSVDDYRAMQEKQPKKYGHIIFRSHDEEACKGAHGHDSPAWPEGCLLDPIRVPWREIMDKKLNNAFMFAVQYQQEDADPEKVLVKKVWIDGGVDPDTHSFHHGCWDDERAIGQVPKGLPKPWSSFATVDPSGENWWAIQWWLYAHKERVLYLMDLEHRQMGGNQLLDWDNHTQAHTGVMLDFQQASRKAGAPIRRWVIENNTLQRWLVQYNHAKTFKQRFDTDYIAHQTGRNKLDPDLGVTSLGGWFRDSRISLPGLSREACKPLTHEVTTYPGPGLDDQVMALWFGIHNLPRVEYRDEAPEPARRPGVVSLLPGRRTA